MRHRRFFKFALFIFIVGLTVPLGMVHAVPAWEVITPIQYGANIKGALTETDSFDLFFFDGQAGDIVTITMLATRPENLDTRLFLYTEDSYSANDPAMSENDNAAILLPGETDSQIGQFELPASDTYLIVAARANGQGIYTLVLELGVSQFTRNLPTLNEAGELMQWASGASASSEYTSTSWSALQATGAPDSEGCGDMPTAWASQSSTGADILVLEYDFTVVPSQVNIYQTYNPGSIIRVELISPSGEVMQIPDSADPPGNTKCPGILSLATTGIKTPVNGVRIYLDQTIVGSWNEIDAVQLVGLPVEE